MKNLKEIQNRVKRIKRRIVQLRFAVTMYTGMSGVKARSDLLGYKEEYSG